jgi:hypothetical protein
MYNKILGAILLASSLGAILVSVAFYGGLISETLYNAVLAVDPFVLLVASMLGGIQLVRRK